MKIEEEDIKNFEYLIKLTTATPTDKALMGRLCSKYNMGGCNICASCSEQVMRLHNKIKDFYNKNK